MRQRARAEFASAEFCARGAAHGIDWLPVPWCAQCLAPLLKGSPYTADSNAFRREQLYTPSVEEAVREYLDLLVVRLT